MSKQLITNNYYTVSKSDEALIDGQLQQQFVIKLETWSAVYGDSLVDSEVLFSGTAQEVQDYLTQNNISEVITVGLG